MTQNNDFIQKCTRLDFDPSGRSQARVWNRLTRSTRPTKPFWRKAAAWGVCVLFFAIGFGTSVLFSARSLQTPYATTYATGEEKPASQSLWICVMDKNVEHSGGCRCWQHRAEDAAFMQNALQGGLAGEGLSACQVQKESVQKCEQNTYPGVTSFYDFCEEC